MTGCAPATLMFCSPPQDCIPTDEQWQTPELDVLKTQEKQTQTNVQASEKKRAKHSDRKVVESVILKDHHPGWKFCTQWRRSTGPFTTRKGGCQVTRNVSWFWRVDRQDGDSGSGLVDESGEELERGYALQPNSPEECRPQSEGGTSRALERFCSTERGLARGFKQSRRSERYHLGPNTEPS
ncbi:hypothetical protein NDU88_003580 [Pleurodeles waltl]|uniref:Uncharacterized protein n=1 Tax=Pleurodeles waltl TaxID=8319 RepID=A0AAV7PHA7_PLEWA|nr:hypothetical protein NDU88_003580 [Pleurodeles waltl]